MADRYLRIDEVVNRTGLSLPTIYRRIRQGDFPRQVKLGARASAWLESEVDAWITKKAQPAAA
ncbi:helix-turn-helix transcriptional regulator [Chromobacterium subtsugae]|uniref:helix-turn-helix transcriptional regulator n=1 Tax=Chromobacterium subtsugae TaxID=251747 RepID=UPI000640D95E|nr:AlpA family transcriptional regulator [Chromobacterium subtsugae]